MEARYHLLELAQGLFPLMRIAWVGSEEADRVVAPIVGQASFEQVAIIDEGVIGNSSTEVTPSDFM